MVVGEEAEDAVEEAGEGVVVDVDSKCEARCLESCSARLDGYRVGHMEYRRKGCSQKSKGMGMLWRRSTFASLSCAEMLQRHERTVHYSEVVCWNELTALLTKQERRRARHFT